MKTKNRLDRIAPLACVCACLLAMFASADSQTVANYTGNANLSSAISNWRKFCRTQSVFVQPGDTMVFTDTDRSVGNDGYRGYRLDWSPLSFGGLNVLSNAVSYKIYTKDADFSRDLELGSDGKASAFEVHESFLFEKLRSVTFAGNLVFAIDPGKTLTIDVATPSVTVAAAASFKMTGGGQFELNAPLPLDGNKTLDLTDYLLAEEDSDGAAPFKGSLILDASTTVRLPASARPCTRYKLVDPIGQTLIGPLVTTGVKVGENSVGTVELSVDEEGCLSFSVLGVTSFPIVVSMPRDGSVSVTGTEPNLYGRYLPQTEVTFTATSATRRFVRWFGDVPAAQVSNETVTLTVSDRELQLCPYFAPANWTFDAASETMTDGYWILNTTQTNGCTELVVAGIASPPSLGGILDLSAPVKTADDATLPIVGLGPKSIRDQKELTELYLPETLRRIEEEAICICPSLTTISPFLPASVNYVGSWAVSINDVLAGDLVVNRDGGPFSFGKKSSAQFSQCPLIGSIEFGAGVTNIPFRTCENMKDQSHYSLRRVVFRGDVSEIGERTFLNLHCLEDVWFSGGKPAWVNDSTFSGHPAKTRFHVPIGKRGASWDAFLNETDSGDELVNFVPWRDTDQNAYLTDWAAGGGKRSPIGRTKAASGVGETWILKWFVPGIDDGTGFILR